MQVPEKKTPTVRDAAAKQRFAKNFELLQAGRLRCKNHPEAVAFGVCSLCGAGTCKGCTVAIGSKRYCTADAESLLKRARTSTESAKRAVVITASSVFSYAEGAIAGGLGFLYIVLGMMSPSMQDQYGSSSVIAPSFAFFKQVFAYPSGTVMALGTVFFIAGLADIGVGYFLWRSSKVAGAFALVLAANAAITGAIFVPVFSVVAPLLYLLMAMAALSAGGVIAGWARLK